MHLGVSARDKVCSTLLFLIFLRGGHNYYAIINNNAILILPNNKNLHFKLPTSV